MTQKNPSIEDPGGDKPGDFSQPAPIEAAVFKARPCPILDQESTPMLEAHAPHEPIHTWKDFFIHVATICVGLLIAIGLEQSVEYLHHRHQLREARRELALEIEDNNVKVVRTLEAVGKEVVMLETDVASLRAAQGTLDPTWPKLDYSWRGPEWPEDGAWKALRQGGSLALMPHEELRRYSYLYDGIAAAQVAFTTYAAQSDMAESLALRSANAKVLPATYKRCWPQRPNARVGLNFSRRLCSWKRLGWKQFRGMTQTSRSSAVSASGTWRPNWRPILPNRLQGNAP